MVDHGAVHEWLYRCNAIATQRQLRVPMDLDLEVRDLVENAAERTAGPDRPSTLSAIADALAREIASEQASNDLEPGNASDPLLDLSGRLEALRKMEAAFRQAAQRP